MWQVPKCTSRKDRSLPRSWQRPVCLSLTCFNGTRLTPSEAKRDTIQSLLTYIEQRLEELEQEKQELKEYQEQDRERRCLEYALYYRELDDVSKALEQVSRPGRRSEPAGQADMQIENDHRSEQHDTNTRQDDFNKREEVVQVSYPSDTVLVPAEADQ